jgi:Domain of unknown function (DUF4397)
MRARLALLILPLVAACRADAPLSATPDVPSTATALRVVNAAGKSVDLLIDGQVVLSDIGARTIAPRIAFGAGPHVVKLRSSGTAGGVSVAVTAVSGQTATLAALPAADSISVTALADSGAAPVAGRSKLRVIHLAANAPAIDVWRTQPDFQTPIRVMFPFAYKAQSSYLQSTPGVWVVWVTPADATTPTLASSGSVTIGAGEVRTLVILDAPGGGVQVKPLE